MMEKEIFEVYIDDIIPNRFQPRRHFEEKALNDLANSIKNHGIIQPLVVRKIGDKYEIIAGERRYKAAQLAGVGKVPVVIKNLDDIESAELALIENLQRQNLTPIEEALSFEKLLKKSSITQEELARRMGISQPQIANKLRLLNLDKEVQEALLLGKISERHARSLLNIDSFENQRAMLKKIITKRMTVRETDEEIKKMVGDKITTFEGDIQSINPEEVITNQTTTQSTDVQTLNQINEQNISIPTNIVSEPFIDNNPAPVEPVASPVHAPNRFIPDFLDEEPTINNEANILEPKEYIEPVATEEIEHIEFLEENKEPIEQLGPIQPVAAPTSGQGLTTAIKDVRHCVKEMEMSGINVDTEEFDFEEMYQIIIKIDKKKADQ